MSKYLFFIPLLILVFACNVDSDDDVMTPDDDDDMTVIIDDSPKYLLKETRVNGQIFSSREYDQDSLLTKISFYRADTIWSVEEYIYLGNTIRVNTSNSIGELLDYKVYYPLSSDQVRVDHFNLDGSLNNFNLYVYSESESCGYTFLYFYNPDETIFSSYEADYLDENCSVLTTALDDNGAIISKEEIIRDNKSVYIQSKLLDLIRLNNLGSTTSFNALDENDDVILSSSYVASTVYNDDDYPASQSRIYLNGSTENYTFEYY